MWCQIFFNFIKIYYKLNNVRRMVNQKESSFEELSRNIKRLAMSGTPAGADERLVADFVCPSKMYFRKNLLKISFVFLYTYVINE